MHLEVEEGMTKTIDKALASLTLAQRGALVAKLIDIRALTAAEPWKVREAIDALVGSLRPSKEDAKSKI